MKIMFFTPYFLPYNGGVERFVDEVSSRLTGFNNVEEVSIVTSNSLYKTGNQNEFKPFEMDRGRKIFRLNFSPKSIPFLYHSYNAGYFSLSLFKILREIQPDIIHFCKFEWFVPNFLVSKYCACPPTKQIFFLSYHPKILMPQYKPMIYFNRNIFININYAHSPNIKIIDGISETLNFPPERIIHIPLGAIDHSLLKSQHDKINIINVGRINERKGQVKLAKLFLSLPQQYQNICNLYFVGNDDGDALKLKELTINKPNIQVLENINDSQLKRLYSISDIYASMSLDELFGLSVIEAMSFGISCIAYENLGNLEFINKDSIGIFIKPNDENNFSDNLIKLIESQDLRTLLGKSAKEIVLRNYSWDLTAKSVMDLYMM